MFKILVTNIFQTYKAVCLKCLVLFLFAIFIFQNLATKIEFKLIKQLNIYLFFLLLQPLYK